MKTEFARSRRHGLPLAVAIFNVDRLRSLVDLYGVELRDAVREALSKMIVGGTRSSDFVGTVSEDRFVLLMPHTDAEQAQIAAERVRARFAELTIRARGQELALALSGGVATNADKETLFFDTLLSQAELALDWAQHSGGNQVLSFSRERFASEEQAGAGDERPDRVDPAATPPPHEGEA